MKKKSQPAPTFDVPLKKGMARILGDARGGRSAELRHGERARGDRGGGEREDGVPNVPHGTDESPPRRGEG